MNINMITDKPVTRHREIDRDKNIDMAIDMT
jgi:hypothetical protein